MLQQLFAHVHCLQCATDALATAASHSCSANSANPCIEQNLRTRTMLKMSSCVQPAQQYASLPFGARPLFAMRNGAARHCCLTTAPVRHHRNPCIEQSLRCCLTTAPVRHHRNPCIEQSLRKHTMLRCHPACIICFNNFLRTSTVCNAQLMRSPLLPRNCSANSATLASNKACAHAPCSRCRPACRPQSYILQQRFAHIQCLQYTTEPLGTAASQLLCSATSATLASNKACAHAPCSRCRPACSPHSCMLHYLLAHVHCLQCATEPLGTAASQLLRSATSATLASNKACAHTPCSRCRPACRPNSLYASTIFCAGPTFAMRNGAARHCCLATAPLRNQRNPCIEQSLRTCTMLRCRPACRPHRYMRQHLFAHVQCLQYTAEALSGLTVAPLRNQHNPCI